MNQYSILDGPVEEMVDDVDEEVLEQPVEAVDVEEQSSDKPVELSVDDRIAQTEAVWKAQVDALSKRLEALNPLLQEAESRRTQAFESGIAEIVQKVSDLNDLSETPLEPDEMQGVGALIREGAEYQQWKPWISQNMVAANAITMAGKHLGRNATIGELQDLARELSELQDERLMTKHLAILERNRGVATEAQRRTIATERIVSGVDRVTPAPTTNVSASDYRILEQKYGDGTATPAEAARFEKLYPQLRRGGSY